ncbi:1-phosphatidylinositol 4,5-bisphosphate phosphodiesterase gamma-1 [Lingula anatina]|uniref:1-phosphatidylinositol 4,5-bisphosphate phosphodiesterase gamma n=1 Tax=Lingula anatina TaxID=7574 RepID=A0A1S3H5X7_LINAN|nr:1-phosphatidylinositol 4,5-bisphosphate phosphodiesterase gamma-1 [Lingula anatina]|eukprot:XP_013381403.1 1-phosphatidylinositol 4,5-bisphosphate phosphodiesterase gamma-1 [Lingula anatina]
MAAPRSGGSQLYERTMMTTLKTLERGLVLTKFYPKKKPERRTFQVKLETRELVCVRAQNARPEQTFDLREVKEIRPGKNSKDFEKWPEEGKKMDKERSFVILYGMEFRLKTLSLVASTQEEYRMMVDGLRYLSEDTQSGPYPLQVERWLRKEFYTLENRNHMVSVKDIKSWLPRVNYKISNTKLREQYQMIEPQLKEIGFEQFSMLYHNLIHVHSIFTEYFPMYSRDGDKLTAEEFEQFLIVEQKDPLGNDSQNVLSFMRQILESSDPIRAVKPHFTHHEFLDYLYSDKNTIWEEDHEKVNQDMTKPLSQFWIASSHNTYLTGDQFSSESSTEAYGRCLRMGARCIELDCWDGPEGMPYIYHGHTLTSKVKFLDVLKTIAENAWVTSEYPVILSIENHCSLQQQRNMANGFKEVFGDQLLTEPIDKEATQLPSPEALKRKFILKCYSMNTSYALKKAQSRLNLHKKLPEGALGDEWKFAGNVAEDSMTEADLSSSVKNGMLWLEDPVDNEWYPHYFVLTATRLHYTEETSVQQADDEEEEVPDMNGHVEPREEGVSNEELHFSEKWFHGKLEGGRRRAEELLNEYAVLGDGTFLVRESDTFVGDFSLSFWRQGKVNHCRIKSRQERGEIRYYLIDNVLFESLYSLVTFYRNNPLRSQDFEMILGDPVPQPQSHKGQKWYHEGMDRAIAEDMLARIPFDGAFLLRHSEFDSSSYAISFRAEGKIKHCRIKLEGRLFTIGNAQFESLLELVQYYEKNPLYRKMRLKYAVNAELVSQIGMEPDANAIYGSADIYMNPNDYMSKVKVKALYDYHAQRADELSFCKHAIVSNVHKQDGGWWRGDYGGNKQMWFPSNYVEELEISEDSDSTPLGSLQKGMLEVTCCIVDKIEGGKGSKQYVFRVISNGTPLEIAASSEEDMLDWMKAIKDCANMAELRSKEHADQERALRIAKEFSDIIVYCRSVPFNESNIPGNYYEMSSFSETKVEKYVNKLKGQTFMKYNQNQLSRIYPKGQRIDSSNYDPTMLWICGSQMCALNYQTPDRSMQLNEGKFKQNGKCGYILQPEIMRHIDYDPFDKRTLVNVDPLTVTLTIIGARHLVKSGRGIASPFVEVEICGAEFDNGNKYKTRTKVDNGFNPVWNDQCEFDIINPEVAMIRFVVQDEDMFGDPNFLGQASFPVKSIRPGYRSVPLTNGYSEPLELAALLVRVDMRNPTQSTDSDIYACIQDLRDRSQELHYQIAESERVGNTREAEEIKNKLKQTEEELIQRTDERHRINKQRF